jgi:hypothetical protein
VTAFLLGRELVLEVYAARARLDHRLHELEGVNRPSKTRFRIGHDRDHPRLVGLALAPVDLVGSQERIVQPPDERRDTVHRIDALIRIRLPREVAVGRDLPPRKVDCLEARAHHLHRLRTRERAERAHQLLGAEQRPQPRRRESRDRLLDADRAAKRHDILGRVLAPNARPARFPPLLLQLPYLPRKINGRHDALQSCPGWA